MVFAKRHKGIWAVMGWFFGFVFFARACGLFAPASASAATLSVATSRATYAIGDTVVARVYVGSAGQASNAFSGSVTLPSVVDFTNVSVEGSIVSFWVQQPSYVSLAHQVSFSGVAMNPGFIGDRGLILTITARAKSAGTDSFSIVNGSVLANDGNGTQILTSVANVSITVAASEVTSPPPPAPSGAPVISSPTHPDQTKWYNTNSVAFTWPSKSSVVATRLVYDQNRATLPAVSYSPPIWSKTIDKSDDGTWYFRVQEKTADGWGAIGTYRVNIDTAPPNSFAILAADGVSSDNPRPTIVFHATDNGSGVDHYTISLDGQAIATLAAGNGQGDISYAMPLQTPGQKMVSVDAFDAAGNSTRANIQLTVVPIASPVIDSYPLQSAAGDPIIIRGHAATSGESIIFTLTREDGQTLTQSASTTSDGTFAFVWPTMVSDGVYMLSAYAIDARGARSNPTAPLSLVVQQAGWMKLLTSSLLYGSVLIFVILFLIGATFIVLFLLRRLRQMREAIGIGKRKTKETLHDALIRLAAHVRNHVDILERTKSQRRLSEEESALLTELRDDMENIEEKIKGTLETLDHEEKK